MIGGDTLDAWMRQIELTLLRLDARSGRIEAQPSPIGKLVEEAMRLRVLGGGAGHAPGRIADARRADPVWGPVGPERGASMDAVKRSILGPTQGHGGYAARSAAGAPPPGDPLLASVGKARLLRGGYSYPPPAPVDPLLAYQGLDPAGLARLRRAVRIAGLPRWRRSLDRLLGLLTGIGALLIAVEVALAHRWRVGRRGR